MARKPKPKPQAAAEPAKTYDEFVDDSESVDDDAVVADAPEPVSTSKSRDWRDVERFKELRLLRQLVDDDLTLDELDGRPGRRR